jgi:hypothetical protein
MNKEDLLKAKQYFLDSKNLLQAFSLFINYDDDDFVYDVLYRFITENKLNKELAYGNIAIFYHSTTFEIQLKFIDYLIKYNELILFE